MKRHVVFITLLSFVLIERSLQSIFGTSDKVSIYYRDVNDLDPDVAGEASFQKNDVSNEVDIKVVLNQNTLPGASKEYIVSTIIHESLHAYFRYRNSQANLDHDIMAVEYINWFMDIMGDIFPNITQIDNNALAWGGLGETAAWARKSSAERSILTNIDISYKTREKGTNPCP